ncbi:geranylgeranyl reductase family protein [Rhodocytophaga aerolata]|uniref:Geranylgeranyl reductase family protein n=1 Tax=Rhodocytophaga aerolata TaxID=455078 RepID=A0ABT8R7W1_9BACT|nr:geranylgeranyl reductase family protein [Rhodocytophaga aerolata]
MHKSLLVNRYVYDVLIAGGGPAGCASALRLANAGLRVALLDKASFPRDKICGDALSVDVLNQLPILSQTLAQRMESSAEKTHSYGVRIISPGGHRMDIPFIHKGENRYGYICQRTHFDNLLFSQVKQSAKIDTYENCLIQKAENAQDRVMLYSNIGVFEGQMVIGADGAHSIIGKQLAHLQMERPHHSAGLRLYYEGVEHFHPQNFIELYFFREILPGYLWIFPLPGNKANVGIGMLSSSIAAKKLNLKHILQQLLDTHPLLKERFQKARPLESIKGFGLPLGSKKRAISGERFVLTGDAASLIDPFTGEGIGNAIRSGRVAAEHCIACFKQNTFSASFNKQYDNEIYRRMWNELSISRSLQNLCRYPWLFNFLLKKASTNAYLQQFFTDALADVNTKRLLTQPSFYYRLLFNK